MKFGIHIPNICPEDFHSEDIREICVKADRLGFDSLWAGDHLLPPKPFGSVKIHEVVSILSFLAGCTDRIRLGTSVILPLRHPVPLANMLSTLDVLSNGRLNVGFGIGWYEEEFEAVDVPFKTRNIIEEETIDIIKKLWAQDNVSYEGKYFKVNNLSIRPKPLQNPSPPILLGGYSEQTFKRTAKQADGWISWCTSTKEFEAGILSIKNTLAALGRKDKEMEYVIDILTCIDKDEEKAKKAAKQEGLDYSKSIVGNAASCQKRIKEYMQAGADHIAFVPRPYGKENESIDLIAQEVIPAMKKK